VSNLLPIQKVINAARILNEESEEYSFDDGLGRGAPQQLWDDLDTALEEYDAQTATGAQVTDDQVGEAIRAYVQAGKRGEELMNAMRAALEAALAQRNS